ncbi:hypothetical protein OF829_04560 [Sphingomonas sp. LB-2]|uniref:hypothetical protein n=1 Tax=Sphingomonas caeni TaxID=2984949 RepID=UPI0022310035|nr:hypothetical protein [Sphingomonas caeni]MCW3846499.1 hypothetical protein [Sphingomonas caeni]
MSGLASAAAPLKCGLVLTDPVTAAVKRVIVLQYTPEKLSRSLTPAAPPAGGRSEPLRLTGPAAETFKLDAILDATDQLAAPSANPAVVEFGLQPALAALELVLYPESGQLENNNRLMDMGTLEIVPMESPLILFVWSKTRILPVRITEFSVTEEEFDPALNPIRARVSMGMKVLNTSDLPFRHRGSALFMNHLVRKEGLARKIATGTLEELGLGGPP